MRILIEAHHPAHIHFWKYPVRELIDKGHEVLMIGRDRDVMKRLLEVYDWIPSEVPKRSTKNNRLPFKEMVERQWTMFRAIRRFEPDVVTSLMGSYCQTAKLLGCRNIIFTDTETQAFNHLIAHPFADEIHTPDAFGKDLGRKHRRYRGIHELCFLDGRNFEADPRVVSEKYGLVPGEYVLIRLSAWNTLHDRDREGIGSEIYRFVDRFKNQYRLVLSAEENKVPPGLKEYAMRFAPEDFHHILAFARFVLTEGASTSSEAACLGVPSVFVNSTDVLGVPLMLEKKYALVRSFREGKSGVDFACSWVGDLENDGTAQVCENRARLLNDHRDVVDYVVTALLKESATHFDQFA